MAISQLTKQASETFSIYGGIANVAQTGEQITAISSEVTCQDKDGTDAADLLQGNPSVSSDGLKLYQRIKADEGVETASPYCITFKMGTNQNNLFEKDVFLYVKEKPRS